MPASPRPATVEARPPAALVTGGARRIGRAIVEALAARGFAVAIHAHRSAAAAEALAATLRAAGGRAVTVTADLAHESETERLVAAAATALGQPLTLLVNNAARFGRDRALTATKADWDQQLAVNLRAPFVLSQTFARALPETAHGLIVNLLDQRVLRPTAGLTTYTLSKAGLWSLTRQLALAFAPRIRVVGIGPGWALADAASDPDWMAAQAAATPLGLAGGPEDIARALLYAWDSPALTGQMLTLDGGQHLA